MSIKSGFYNSVNHDRKYGVSDISQLFDGLISEGVYSNVGHVFNITASSTEGDISVNTGRAWLNQTWTYNDAPVIIHLSEASTFGDRWDAVCIEVNGTNRENSLVVVQGTPGSGRPDVNSGLSAAVKRWALAYIFRAKSTGTNALTVTNADIYMVVGTEETPFVTALLETVAVDSLLEKWQIAADAKIEGLDEAVREIFSKEVPAGYLSEKFSATISSSLWAEYSDGGASVFKAEKAIAGLLATDDPILDLDLSSVTGDNIELAVEAFGYVYRATTSAGSLTLYALEKPEADLPIKLQTIRK